MLFLPGKKTGDTIFGWGSRTVKPVAEDILSLNQPRYGPDRNQLLQRLRPTFSQQQAALQGIIWPSNDWKHPREEARAPPRFRNCQTPDFFFFFDFAIR